MKALLWIVAILYFLVLVGIAFVMFAPTSVF